MTENLTQTVSPEPPLKAFPWKALGLWLLIGFILAMFWGTHYISQTEARYIADGEQQAAAFANKDVAYAFVREHYIGCTVTPPSSDKTVCAGATIALANEQKGSDFAHAVAHAIIEWDKTPLALRSDTRRRVTLIAHVLPFFKDLLNQ